MLDFLTFKYFFLAVFCGNLVCTEVHKHCIFSGWRIHAVTVLFM